MPSQLNPKVPAAVDAIVMKCLEENPGDRYETAGALKDALLNAFAGQLQNSGSAGETIARVESFMGKCRFLDTIREDRFGATYLVENGETKKLYIIKKKKSGAGLKEARILSSLKHKNIANILGAGGDSKKTVIVTEYVQGGSLADRPGRTYDWQEAMEIIVQIAEGLNFAHINNLRHGNLRPSNILFAADDVIKLTDFGFPPHYDSQKDWYAPPEKKQTRQGDMFSLGVILFMLMTNKIPQHDRAGNPYLGKLETKIPKKIQEILRRLLQIRAVKRYQSLEEMLVEYSEYLEVKNAPRVKVAAVPRPGKKKNYMPLILAGAAIILGAMLALYWDKLIGG